MFRSFQFLNSYHPLGVFFELAVIWVCVFLIFRFLRGTRGAGIVKGLALLFIILTLTIRVLGQDADAFRQLNFIYDRFLGILTILLIVVFQPELRQAMIRLGHTRIFRGSQGHVSNIVESTDEAVRFLCKNQFGALIAIERSVKLGGLVEGGQELDAKVSARLLESIFWPNSPLHDLGVVIRGNRIVAAGVQFPLAEEGMLPPNFGSRHRAGLGLTLETDCIVIIVSEETGSVTIAERGKVSPGIPREDFAGELARRLESPLTDPESPPTETTETTETSEDSVEGSEDDKEAA